MSNLSINALKTELLGDVKSAVRAEVFLTARKVLIDAINKNIYQKPEGTDYVRTGDFLNAVRVKDIKESGTMVSFTVWVDGSLLRPVVTLLTKNWLW